MGISTRFNGNQARIVMDSRFEFKSHRDFKSAYMLIFEDHPEVTEIAIDLGGVAFIDSSALGMLLLLKDRASTAGKSVVLSNATGEVLKVLEIANFSRIFEIRNL